MSVKSANDTINSKIALMKYQDDEKYKDLKPKGYVKITDTVVEFTYSYLSKYSYLNENEEPNFIHEYCECFVWIDTERGFLAIKNAPEKILTILKNMFANAYLTQISNIKLTKKLICDIFGSDKIKRGSYINPNASQNEAEKIILSDARLSEKQLVQESVSDYDMTGTYLNECVGDGKNNTLGINCNKGKIYLTSNVSATDFRNWSVERISSIISYLSNAENYCDFEVFQAKNITDLGIWDGYTSEQKKLIEVLCYATYIATINKQDSTSIDIDIVKLRQQLSKHLYNALLLYCDFCDEPFFPSCECGSHNLTVTTTGAIICNECGDQIKSVLCDKGHRHTTLNRDKMIMLYPHKGLYDKIVQSLSEIFQVKISGSFYINDGKLVITNSKQGGIVEASSVPELATLCKQTLSQSEYERLLPEVQSIKEKCGKSTNKNCNECVLKENPKCMMKLFTIFKTYRPSPHQAGEFGDVSFTITLDGSSIEMIGIAKSADKGKDSLNLSENAAREMLQQVLSATHDGRVGAIAAICPMRFHDQLKEELRYIAKLTGKKVIIMDDLFMVNVYREYQTSLKGNSETSN